MARLVAVGLVTLACGDATAPPKSVPPGSEIVYSMTGAQLGLRELFLVGADGASNRPFPTMPGDKSWPSWSPDGRTLLFVGKIEQDWSLWVVDEDGTELRRGPTASRYPARWSPNSGWIVAATPRPNLPLEISAMRVDGTGRYSLTPGLTDVAPAPPAWSRRGRIAFERERRDGSGGSNLWSVRADGSDLVRLTSGIHEYLPVWSPDGDMLAYSAYVTVGTSAVATPQVVVANANGSSPRVLTGADGSTYNEVDAWSPDGRWLLYHRYGGGCTYYKVALSGGPSVSVTPTGADCGGASWR